MKQDISSYMDGEPVSGPGPIRDESAREVWYEYHLIGDVLRGEAYRQSGVSQRVFERLGKEPTVLAPGARPVPAVTRVALALAASVATIAVVGWMGMQQGGETTAPTTLAVAPAPVAQPVARTPRPAVPAPDPHDYLVAHRQIPSAEFYRPVAARQP